MELLPVFQDDAIFTMKPGLHLLDAIYFDNGRTMNSPKLPRVKLLFQTADRFAQEIAFLIVVDLHVVSFRLDAVNILHVQKEDSPSVFDYKSLEVMRSGF